MPRGEVERRTMWISVWHSDMFGRNDFLGEVMMPMAGQVFDDPAAKWYSLQDRVSLTTMVYDIYSSERRGWGKISIDSENTIVEL